MSCYIIMRYIFTWTPPRARISVAPAFFMAYRVLGCTFPVALLVGAVQIIFFTYFFVELICHIFFSAVFTPAALATPAVITAAIVYPYRPPGT